MIPTDRVFNFGAGPATLPVEVLEQAAAAVREMPGLGLSILELGHRTPEFDKILADAEADIRALSGAGDEWTVLFLAGGASLQFHMVPLNLGPKGDYAITGTWSEKALEEARKLGTPRVVGTSAGTKHDRIPATLDLAADASFVHVTSNNTIYGTQWRELPTTKAPLVVDASSDIFARPLPLERCGVIYAGAQKNAGAAGVTLVLVRKELLARSKGKGLPSMLDWSVHAANGSRFNTCPTFAIYVLGLMARWTVKQGGVAAMSARAEARAAKVYAAIDASGGVFRGHAVPEARSRMNVTFRCRTEELEKRFLAEAEGKKLVGLAGHRSVGGARASLYNALPDAAVDALCKLMREFSAAAAEDGGRLGAQARSK